MGGDNLNYTRRKTLTDYRKQKGWLQKDVVERLDEQFNVTITESYYGMIGKGVRTPSLNVALAIAKLFNVDPAIFYLIEQHFIVLIEEVILRRNNTQVTPYM